MERRSASLLAVVLLAVLVIGVAAGEGADWKGVDRALGRSGQAQGDMYKVAFPRSDLTVKVGDVKVEPGLGLTSWIAFRGMGDRAMMMGDLVLLEREVTPVASRLVAQGIKISALHNHLLNAVPVVMYLHVDGEGKPETLAAAVRSALSLTATPMAPPAPPAAAVASQAWRRVEAIMGKEGQKKGNLLQFSFNRKERITENGMEVPPFFGVASPVNFEMVGNQVASTGDFVLLANEVNPVVKELLNHNIAVTAIHSHMLFESPRLFFLHFWAHGEPEAVAQGLNAALNRMNLSR